MWCAEFSVDSQPGSTKYSLYHNAAKAVNPWAIGNLIMNKLVLHENIEGDLKILSNLAESGNIDAICRMGNLYYDGVGVSKDYAEALKWYQKSATLGHAWSKLRVGDMYRDGKGTQIDYEKSYFWYSK